VSSDYQRRSIDSWMSYKSSSMKRKSNYGRSLVVFVDELSPS
jgi:hypothetical protein